MRTGDLVSVNARNLKDMKEKAQESMVVYVGGVET